MKNPYEVLGVSENATLEEIKAAYRELVKKYHPDKYSNNPLSDLAAEKMAEINEAYDYLNKNHGNSNGYHDDYQYNGYRGSGDYSDVRLFLSRGDLISAERLLNNTSNRDAEWHYLYGVLQFQKGWYQEAKSSVATAISLDPVNREYRQAYNSMLNPRFTMDSNNMGYNNNSFCKALQCFICADCLCPCI